jgi:hypothetical protein
MVDFELVPTSFHHPDPYPRLWNWEELKQVVGVYRDSSAIRSFHWNFIDQTVGEACHDSLSGTISELIELEFSFRRDLGKLLRHPKFQQEYDAANVVLAKEHGSVGVYLVWHYRVFTW